MSKGGGGTQYIPTFQQSSSNTNTSQNIPDWLTSAAQGGIGAASQLMRAGTPNYTGELAPGLTADQQAAGGLIRNSIGAYQPYFTQAQDYTNASTAAGPAITPETYRNGLAGISSYMNPYISNVVDSVSKIGQQNLDTALKQTGDQAIGAKAFGGSRHGVQEGVATAQNNLQTNNLIANLMNQGYGQATSMLGQDIGNNLQAQQANQGAFQNWMARLSGAGGQTANIGTNARSANAADMSNLLNYGSLAQQTQGQQDQAAYQNWLFQQQYPFQALQAYNQTVQGAPHSTSGTSSTNTTGVSYNPQQAQTSNALMGGLGGAMSGAQLGSYFGPWGTAIGAGAGGLLGAIH